MTKLFAISLLLSLSWSASASLAQEIQSDGTMLMGGIRLNPAEPPPGEQRDTCTNEVRRLAGIFAMNFVGVEPWITNHPGLERNCATLLDIQPVADAPQIAELRKSTRGWWSRVTRVKMPKNKFGWREALGFGWCADEGCKRQLLLLFTQGELIGFCSAQPGTPSGTRYALTNPQNSEAWVATTEYQSCLHDPRYAVAQIAQVPRLEGARRFVPPKITMPTSGEAASGGNADGQYHVYANNREQMAKDAARLQAEQDRAAQAFEKLREPNSIGW